VSTALAGAGVKSLVLRHAALALSAWPDAHLRAVPELDLLVRPADAEAADAALRTAGWTTAGPATARALPLRRAGEPLVCTLHRDVAPDLRVPGGADATAPWWDFAVELTGPDTGPDGGLRTLGPTDQLLHVCLDGARAGSGVPVQWAADAIMLLRAATVDWHRLHTEAVARRGVLRLADALRWLVAVLDAPVPDTTLAALAAEPTSRRDRLVHRAAASGTGPLRGLPQTLASYARASEDAGLLAAARGLPRFLAETWNVASPRHVPRAALQRARATHDEVPR